MGRLRCRLAEQVTEVLTPETIPVGAPHGRWPKAWSLVKAILGGRADSGGAQLAQGRSWHSWYS